MTVSQVAIVGAGVIGAGWASRFLAAGASVTVWDPEPAAFATLEASIERAWPPMRQLGLARSELPPEVRCAPSLREACTNAEFVQENAPEREALKIDLLQQIDACAPTDCLIASSTSGLLPSRLQSTCAHPDRVLVGHPFNPVHLLPLVEVVGGERTSAEAIERATEVYQHLGMRPLRVRNEIEGHLSDRLQEAMWREILHLVRDGVATPAELDDAIRFGPGLRWAIFGTSLVFHMAGGAGGMRHMLEQFGPALELPWTHLEAPPLDDELIRRMVEGTEAQAGGRSVAELEEIRDECLVAILEVLAKHDLPG